MYQHLNTQGNEIWNRSYFHNAHFIVDEDYRGGNDFEAHVSMWRVSGVLFSGCVFENQQTNIGHSTHLGEGIVAIEAHFIVKGMCSTSPPWPGDVCPGYERTQFIGFGTGIDARNSGTARGFVVDHCYFENNICGVYANSVNGFSVKNSEFVIGSRTGVDLVGHPHDQFIDRHRGIFSTECTMLTIDDNYLHKADNPSHETEGIVVGYTRENNEVVFRNRIAGIDHAYVGEGISADVDNNNAVEKGLWFLCNENLLNNRNFWSRMVTGDEVNPLNTHTIRTFQGTSERPADNTFDLEPGIDGEADFKVSTTYNPITYWHSDEVTYKPEYYTLGYLNPVLATTIPENNCASKILGWTGGNVVIGLKSYMSSEKMAYGNTRYLYEQLIDGGNTDEVVLEIQQSWPQDAWELRDQLLSRSPYLSDTVLREVVRRDIMPEAMLTEILVANPDGTRSNNFLQWLQERSGHPLPEYLLGMVVASWDNYTYRSALENQMAHHHGEMSAAASMLVAHYNADTTAMHTDSLRWVFQQIRTPGARYAEALSYMDQGHLDSAYAVVENLNVEFELRTPQAEERQRMLDMIAFWQEHFSGGRNAFNLDSAQVQALGSIMAQAYDRPASLISNLLCVAYGHCRPPLTGGEEDGTPKNLPYTPLPIIWEHLAPTLSLKPNPANTWVAIDYKLVGSLDDVVLSIQDVNGRSLFTQRLQDSEGQVVWDTRSIAQGTYTVIIRQGKDKQKSETLIIQR